MSMAFNTHPQSLYVMLGMATRIAQRMGLHHEATLSKYSPFEAEMRRRLWWSLVLFESRIGEQSEKGGARNSTLSPIWDCKPPTNISDSDLRPEMKTSAVAGSRCTEAIFSVVRSQLADYLRFADFFLDFTNPALKHVARAAKMGSVEDGGGGDRISVLETEMEDKYIRFCDPTNPVQLLTIGTTRTFFARCRLLCHLSSHAGPSLPHMSEGEMDTATLHAIRMLEGDTMATASPSTKRYQWFMASYFPLPAYLRVAQEIRARPLGPRVDRAWGALTDNFAARMVFKLGYGAGAFTPLNRIIVQAWDAYEGALVREGRSRESIAVPGIVGQVRQLAAEYEMVSTPAGGSPGTDDFNMGFGEFQGTGLPMLFGGPGFPDTMGQESFLAVGDAAGLGGVPPQQAMGSMNLNDVGWYYSQ
ncbi:fungal specific transcription factor domain-containing protein [Candidatus Bathyarchaeota archaeon]|nr:fungal specific transcription factor domain-containing protein [Candidatus Bathyarchaeota archaeon]